MLDLDDDQDAQERADRKRALELFAKVKDSIEALLDGPTGETFLEWLALVSYANRSTFHANERVHCFREGKRALFHEIARFKELTPGQLLELRERKHIR